MSQASALKTGEPQHSPGQLEVNRIRMPPPILAIGEPELFGAYGEILQKLDGTHNLMTMGEDPRLPKMPEKPKLIDFFKLRLVPHAVSHLCQSANLAKKSGANEKIIMACLLHDIAMGALITCDHGYWGAQLIEPYVDEEISWAVRNHQALRYFADESVGYAYPEAYIKFFGKDYQPPAYIHHAYEEARQHKWYMSARLITLNDLYAFEPGVVANIEDFEDIIGRNFRQPKEGLGFDNSPSAHMWRTLIWPRNSL